MFIFCLHMFAHFLKYIFRFFFANVKNKSAGGSKPLSRRFPPISCWAAPFKWPQTYREDMVSLPPWNIWHVALKQTHKAWSPDDTKTENETS